ncbi:MAG: vWA domain-containing protein, partial [Candidatus Heimdallarchaeaceae archaeon]
MNDEEKREVSLKARKLISTARSKLIMDEPFFGSLAWELRMVEMPEHIKRLLRSWGVEPTACTDGKSIMYDPDFIVQHTLHEVITIIAHETLHPALLHHIRIRNRNPEAWNVATDHVINLQLSKAKNLTPLKEWLCDSKYEGMSSEQVYEDIMKNAKTINMVGVSECGAVIDYQANDNNGKDKNSKSGKKGEGNKQIKFPSMSIDDEERKWKRNLAKAYNIAKMAGIVPAGIDRFVEDLIYPKIDWKHYLAAWFTERSKDSYDWLHRNKRCRSIYLPGLQSKTVGEIVIAIDTSGSIDEKMLRKFLGAIDELRGMVKCNVHIISCDANVADYKYFDKDESIIGYRPKGGGGTRFSPA